MRFRFMQVVGAASQHGCFTRRKVLDAGYATAADTARRKGGAGGGGGPGAVGRAHHVTRGNGGLLGGESALQVYRSVGSRGQVK
jgi:hypothetical protein